MGESAADELLVEELHRAYGDEVHNPDNRPFFMSAAGATAAVVLIHGFSASPWEMRPLAEELNERGFACLAVRLPGHGTSAEDLATRRWEEWLAAVTRGYDLLAPRFPRIYGAGLSTGSLLLLMLAWQRQLKGVVLLSPYLRLRHRLAPWVRWLRFLIPYQKRSVPDAVAGYYYPRRPLAGIHQINRLVRAVTANLGKIDVPVLAVHGEGDQVVDIDSGRQLVERMSSQVKIYQRLGPEARHVLTEAGSPCRRSVLDLAGRFLLEIDQRCRTESR
jgi:carboxylesterase